MADWYRFIFGEAASTSTPTTPVLDSTYSEVTINPTNWSSAQQDSAAVSFTLSGRPRMSSTQLPRNIITLSWDFVPVAMKTSIADVYFTQSDKFIMIDDQRRMVEVMRVPGTYSSARRRSTEAYRDSYSITVQLIVLGSGTTMSEVARDAL